MKVSVIGTGYVGLTAACLADFGHNVVLIGRSKDKIDVINQGASPIYEPGLDEVLKRNISAGRLHATTDYKEIDDSDVVFICVGTPSNDDGSIDLSQVEECSIQIAERLKNSSKYKIIVVKSTVVPKTTKNFVIPVLEKHSGKKAGKDFGVGMNPEFLREGTGVYDFVNPDKIVIGGLDEKSTATLSTLYENFDKKFHRVTTDLTTAEMIKYAQNSALAARISFINEIANICEKYSVDVKEVAHAIGLDTRIGQRFLSAGIGFGGSCFPKDVNALISAAKAVGINPVFLQTIMEINERQPHRLVELAKEAAGDLHGKTIAVLGLAFKNDTDDMRESRATPIINSLLHAGANVRAHDPRAMENAKEIFGDKIEYCNSKEECVRGADLCMIVTEWDEFRNLDLNSVKCPVIDGRRVLDPEKAKSHGLIYKGIGYKGNFGV